MRRTVNAFRMGVLVALALSFATFSFAQDANRFTYLDEPCDPYYAGIELAKLATPQWIGEAGVDAVVVLAIDDMRDSARYETYLRPILDRLIEIDGRAPVSIMTNQVDPADPQLQAWLDEGLSIEIHTIDHPCPCLADGDLAKAKSTFDRCVDLMSAIDGNHPVAFRMPCCDSLNTPSPRFFTEVLHQTTPEGRFLTIDSSVFQVFTRSDPSLPGDLLHNADGQSRFRHYLPFPSFVNTIEDYPYPYVIGRMSWQFPCMVPSDWEAQHVQRPNNPRTVEDMQVALDLTVLKQGVFNLVFHPHGWIRNDQVVELIDHAQDQYGRRVKFLTFAEAQQRIDTFMLGGHPLRNERGFDNGVRLVDVNQDGWMDVVIGNQTARLTRLWDPATESWREIPFPFLVIDTDSAGSPGQSRVRLGVDHLGRTMAIGLDEGRLRCAVFAEEQWHDSSELESFDDSPVLTRQNDEPTLDGLVLRDIDGTGGCELILANTQTSDVWSFVDGEGWLRQPYQLPDSAVLSWNAFGDRGVRFVDLNSDGRDDVVVSNESEFGVYLYVDSTQGWSEVVMQGRRGDRPSIPMIARDGTNNGAWFHSDHLWIQNEGTNKLPDLVERMSYAGMLGIQDEGDSQDPTSEFPEPLAPHESLASIKTHPHLKVELVAAEPLIADPIAFDWGIDGALWVVEMGDYPSGVDDDQPPGGRVRVLRDTDGDGQYDQSTIFLADLPFPTGVKVWKDGVIVSAAPRILFASDTDGDDQADHIETLLEGFEEGNQQHRVNGLRWGLDGWIHIANGDSGGTIRSPASGQEINIRGFDLRYHPETGEIERTSGQTQFGRNRDDWGNWYGGNNSNPLWHFVLEDRYIRRNRFVASPSLRRDVPQAAGNAPVYPISNTLTRFNDLHTANRITSACSHMIYRDIRLGEEFYENSFVCEPVHNLVHREILRRDGYMVTSERAPNEQNSEFLASTDNWFRPVMIRTGPDGALWVADMYRLVIEHPEWIPQEWQDRLDLRAGHERGRIYRIVPRDESDLSIPILKDASDEELLGFMESTNGWVRDMAQQMLMWRDADVIDELLELVRDSERPATRVQALCTLNVLNRLTESHIAPALVDDDPWVRATAIRLREVEPSELGDDEFGLFELIRLADTGDLRVTLQLACSIGEFRDDRASQWLGRNLIKHQNDPILSAALLSSLNPNNLNRVLFELLNFEGEVSLSLWGSVVDTAAGYGRGTVFVNQLGMIELIGYDRQTPSQIERYALMVGAAQRIEDELFDDELSELITLWITGAFEVLGDDSQSTQKQLAALHVLRHAHEFTQEQMADIASFVSVTRPLELQLAAVHTLAGSSDPQVASILIERGIGATPGVRGEIIALLLERTTWTQVLLDEVESSRSFAASLSPATWQVLRDHSHASIAERALELSRDLITSDRQSVLDDYADAMTLEGDAARGRTQFIDACSKCHQLGGVGEAVGPDLNALTDRSRHALLVAMLDPNRAVESKYMSYSIITLDGRQFVGMLQEESSTSLALATTDGTRIDVLRADIESVTPTGKSLMPDGLEKDLDVGEVSDVIAFVLSNAAPSKSFPGNEPRMILADDDNILTLPASAARLYGPSIVFEPKYQNLGWWSSEDDWAAWDIEVRTTDTYEVIIEYAEHNDAAGGRFELRVGDQVLNGIVRGTGSWDDYEIRKLGRMRLSEGRHELIFRSDGPVDSPLIDLLEIKLYPFLLDD